MKNNSSIVELKNQNWEFSESDTKYLTHNLHRYSGKFIPQIANKVISALTAPGDLVVDPYCGSGTTLLEAALLNRRAKGFDLNPLAVLIADVKTRPIDEEDLLLLQNFFAGILAVMQSTRNQGLFPNPEVDHIIDEALASERLHDDWFIKWFGEENLRELAILDVAIAKLKKAEIRNVARVAFSEILRRCSKAHSGYPNVMFDKNSKDRARPSKIFMPALEKACQIVGELKRVVNANFDDVDVYRADAQSLPLAECSADAIITHPPYIGSVPYAEYGLLSLMWLGHDPKALDRELTGGRRQSRDVVQRFELGYSRMIGESFRVLKPGRYAFMMVGNPVVKGELIDLEDMTIKLSERIGFSLALNAKRSGSNRRANKMGKESLLFFRKPGADLEGA